MDLVKCWPRLRPAINHPLLAACIGFSLGALATAQDAPVPDAEPPPAAGEAPAGVLDRFVAEVGDFSARFEQSDFDADGMLIEKSAGEFLLLRPGRYLWHYESPDEQLFVADGRKLWWYEVELEQVTEMPLDEWSSTPAALLSGEAAVSDAYRIVELPADGGDRWVELIPIESDLDFRSVRLAFRGGLPVTLELIDRLDELTRIEFFDVEVDTGIDPGRFDFTPPRGVDVVAAN